MRMTYNLRHLRKISILILFATSLAFGNVLAQETAEETQPKPDDPVARVGSEMILERDIPLLPEELVRQCQKQKPKSEQEIVNWRRSYRKEQACSIVIKKMIEVFCEKADCKASEKENADWKKYIQWSLAGMGIKVDADEAIANKPVMAILGGPPDAWKTGKALFEHYGGRIYHGNLGGPSPIEACLRLFHEMEDNGDLQFYDPEIRAALMEYFNRNMQGAIDPKDDAPIKGTGTSNPWEKPFWQLHFLQEPVAPMKETKE